MYRESFQGCLTKSLVRPDGDRSPLQCLLGGHERRFKRESRTSAFPPIPDIALRRTLCDQPADQRRTTPRRIAANIAKLPEMVWGKADGL